jgi:aminopeptidase 2
MTTDLTNKPTDSGDFRLPLDVKPTHYDLTIKTDLENSIFEGVVKIEYVHAHYPSKIID